MGAFGTLYMASGNINFGGEVEGAWRIKRDGNNLIFQRYEGGTGTWVTKDTITP